MCPVFSHIFVHFNQSVWQIPTIKPTINLFSLFFLGIQNQICIFKAPQSRMSLAKEMNISFTLFSFTLTSTPTACGACFSSSFPCFPFFSHVIILVASLTGLRSDGVLVACEAASTLHCVRVGCARVELWNAPLQLLSPVDSAHFMLKNSLHRCTV